MKILLALIILIGLSSCGKPKLPTDLPYVVTKITQFRTSIIMMESKTYCVYVLSSGSDYAAYTDNISVVDSIGKFTIGDSVYISIHKK